MLYSVTADLQKKDISNRYMGPDIHENCELTLIEYKQTEKGNEFIAFYFENELKEKLSHTEWKVMSRRKPESMSEKEASLYLRLVNEQVARVNAIATTYIPEETFRKVGGNSFEEFCTNAIEVIGDAYKGVKVRIKVVFDKRNFTALPSYLNYEWIEPMSIPKEKSRIKILAKDKMVKSAPKNVEGADEKLNEIEVAVELKEEVEPVFTGAAPKDEDELPF